MAPCPLIVIALTHSAALPLPHAQAAATPRTPHTPSTPLTPKVTGSSSCGPQFFDQNGMQKDPQAYGLELFLASEASAVVEHTKQ